MGVGPVMRGGCMCRGSCCKGSYKVREWVLGLYDSVRPLVREGYGRGPCHDSVEGVTVMGNIEVGHVGMGPVIRKM